MELKLEIEFTLLNKFCSAKLSRFIGIIQQNIAKTPSYRGFCDIERI
jgi:hypothetical protein